jgi:phosphatidylserine/phosphatidylglycerophosphate/cardiolipin synthase-like enzyme
MSDWFLPQRDRPWTAGNLVVPHVHGAKYFARLVQVVGATLEGDRIFFADWRGDADELLLEGGPTIGDLLAEAAGRGVEVRGLLWRSHSDKMRFNAQENRHLGEVINKAGGEALFDERVRRGGSHHQKLLVVQRQGPSHEDVAFVGGIDLCHGRRDDAEHLGDPQAAPLDKRYGPNPPWHDATLEIRGPAVSQVLQVFTERWDDPTPLDHRNPYRALLRIAARMPRHPQPLPELWDPPPERGPHRVQILRTYPAKRPPFPFAPHGERTIAQAYERAFARARRLVYIEDQYFWSEVVTGTLADALRREPALQVIAVVPRFPEKDSPTSGTPMRLGQQWARDLLHQAGGDRFAMYDLQNAADTPVYVHAKVCIVDDEWMTCGSDNLNLRSWTHDSEVTCAVVDPEGRLPREFRATLWAEHLGLPPDDPRLLELDHATGLWARCAEAPSARIRPHLPTRVHRAVRVWADPAYRILFDPDGRPRGLRGTDKF